MKDIFYITDLDMTLARNDKTISDITRKGIQKLYENNISFTIATARAYSTLKPIIGDINLHLPIIEFNGGLISNFKTGEPFIINSLPTEFAREIWQIGIQRNVIPLVSTIVNNTKRLYYPKTKNKGINIFINNRRKVNDKRLRPLKSISKVLGEKILSFTFIDTIDIIQTLYELLISKYKGELSMHFYENEYSPGWYWVTVHGKESTKGNAIKQIQKMYDLQHKEIVVFGDNVNDLTMFNIAQRKYAVSNAKEELQIHATGILGTNNDDSVIRFILEDTNLA